MEDSERKWLASWEKLRKDYLKIIFSGAAAAAVFYFLFSRYGADLEVNLLLFSWPLGFLALGFYGLSLALKALRFGLLLGRAVPFPKIFGITAVHSFWNNILPFRAGEFTYLYLLSRQKAVRGGANLASLLTARVFDLAVVASFLFVAAFLLFSFGSAPWGRLGEYALAALAFFPVLALLAAVRWRKRLDAFFRGFAARRRGRIFAATSRYTYEVLEALGALGSPSRFFLVLLLSAAVWLGEFLFVWAALGAATLKLSFLEALFMTAFPVIAVMIPLQSLAGLGTFEGTLLVGLLSLGIEGDRAFSASILFHAELLLFSLAAFLVALRFRGRRVASDPITNPDLYASFAQPEKDFRNANLTDLVAGLVKGKTLLDIGCGYGELLVKAKKKGVEVLGIEPDPVAREVARNFYPDVEVIPTHIEDFKKKRCFDTVTMTDVLEDVKDFKEFVKMAASLVCPGGRLILSAPAFPGLYGERDRMMGYHRRYDRRDLERILKELGFEIKLSRYWNALGLAPYFILYKVLKHRTQVAGVRGGGGKGVFGRFVSGILFWWFKNVENRINFGFGLSIIIVAENRDLT